jgi:hypothetical protein
LAVGLAARLGGALADHAAEDANPSSEDLAALGPYLDTLLPAGDAPAATAVGVLAHVLTKAGGNVQYQRLLHQGCRWLDGQAVRLGAKDFSAGEPAARERIVAEASVLQRGTLPRRFFERTRADAFEHYYAQQSVWVWLGYPGPPQPRGFPEHNQAPPTRAHEA